MDIFYIFRHSPHHNDELRYSLRSVARHLTWIRKVWIFGDRPTWLSDDVSLVEHVPHDRLAWIPGRRLPVVNQLVMMYLSSLLPGLSEDYLWFCDDYIILQPLNEEFCRRPRIIQDLDEVKIRGKGLYKDALWRTFDVLKWLGYAGLNYEVHVPVHLTKRRVLEAVHDFQDFLSDDRYFGLLAKTAVMNHAQRREGFVPVRLAEEASFAGFHYQPATGTDVAAKCERKAFLNFDDVAYSADLRRFLNERFPEVCKFESEAASV